MPIVHFIKELKDLGPGIVCAAIVGLIAFFKGETLLCIVGMTFSTLILYAFFLFLYCVFILSWISAGSEGNA
ncbi:hypothetical protein K8R32_02675 [bacterium]|nr:hypothetical protein [bacterium]